MIADASRPTLTVRDQTTGQHLSWADVLRDVWSGVASPEAFELQVIWPVAPSDVVTQNAHTVW